jgi:hypothetical protein
MNSDWFWLLVFVLFIAATYVAESFDKHRKRLDSLEKRLDGLERAQK